MKILAPIDSISQVKLYAFLGVQEFYCGYIPLDWFEKYNTKIKNWTKKDLQLSLNRREISHANISSEGEIKGLISMSHLYGIDIFITINAPYYAENNYPFILDYAKKMEEYGANGVIISDPGLIKAIRRISTTKIILSTCNQIASIEGVKFMQELGVNRVVFPRHISLSEMEKITNAVPEMEYECFILEGRCIYDDGNCNILHSCGSFCTESWYTQYFDFDLKEIQGEEKDFLRKNEFDHQRYASPYLNTNPVPGGWRNGGCGLCALPYIVKNIKMDSVKIAGRGIDERQKLKNVSILKKTIQMATEGKTKGEIQDYMKVEVQSWPQLCDNGYRCYFPDAQRLK